jgi:hypothetical protein
MSINLDDIHSNNIRRCAVCGIPITPANDSGWEVFAEDGKKTQPICGWCEAERSMTDGDMPKANDEGGEVH